MSDTHFLVLSSLLFSGIQFKKRAPRAISALRAFARKQMCTEDVRIDAALNRAVWKQGVKHVPNRIRVRLLRQRNKDEMSANKLFTLVQYLPFTNFKGSQTERVEQQ